MELVNPCLSFDATNLRRNAYSKNQGMGCLHKDFIKTIENDTQHRSL